jgi:hypothetical protein
MSKRLISLVVATALVALGALSLQSSALGARNCGGGVRAVVVDCGKASRIAKEYKQHRASFVQGYRCSSHQKGGSTQARCVLDNKAVVFSF